MSRASVQQFSTDPTANTDIAGINVGPGWPPLDVGPGFRTLMALVASALNPQSITLSGSTLTLTAAQASAQVKSFIGTLSTDCQAIVPATALVCLVTNATVGGRNVVVSTGAGTTVTIPPDGNYYQINISSSGNVSFAKVGLATQVAATLLPQTIAVSGTSFTVPVTQATSGRATLFSGALAVDCVVVLPNAPLFGSFANITTGGRTLNVVSAGLGTAVSIPNDGNFYQLLVDGNGNVSVVGLGVGAISAANASLYKAKITVGVGAPAPGVVLNPNGVMQAGTTAGTDGFAFLAVYNNGVLAGAINYQASGGVAYTSASDQTLKLDDGLIDPAEALALIRRVRPRWFRWKAGPDEDSRPGFFAQQLHRVFPWAVTRGKGRAGSKGHVPWAVDASKLMPVIVAGMQELDARLTALERSR